MPAGSFLTPYASVPGPVRVDYLLRGAHDSVAVTFGVHAFVVDAGRERLRDQPTSASRV